MSHVGQSDSSDLKVGSSGGRRSKTSTVMRTAKTPSENALSRSVVLLACGTAVTLCTTMRRSVAAHQCSEIFNSGNRGCSQRFRGRASQQKGMAHVRFGSNATEAVEAAR